MRPAVPVLERNLTRSASGDRLTRLDRAPSDGLIAASGHRKGLPHHGVHASVEPKLRRGHGDCGVGRGNANRASHVRQVGQEQLKASGRSERVMDRVPRHIECRAARNRLQDRRGKMHGTESNLHHKRAVPRRRFNRRALRVAASTGERLMAPERRRRARIGSPNHGVAHAAVARQSASEEASRGGHERGERARERRTPQVQRATGQHVAEALHRRRGSIKVLPVAHAQAEGKVCAPAAELAAGRDWEAAAGPREEQGRVENARAAFAHERVPVRTHACSRQLAARSVQGGTDLPLLRATG